MSRKYASQSVQQKTRPESNREATGKMIRKAEQRTTLNLVEARNDDAGEKQRKLYARREEANLVLPAHATASAHDKNGESGRAKRAGKSTRAAKSRAAGAPERTNKGLESRPPGRKRVNAAVLESLLEEIEEGVAHVSTKGEVLYANTKFVELLCGRAWETSEGRALRDFLPPACWHALEAALNEGSRTSTEGLLHVHAELGTIRTVRLMLSPGRWKEKATIQITAQETTELLEKNRQLQDKEASLHALSARILQLQDEERRRIARDLHDITGQELAVVIMQMMEVLKSESSQEARDKITDATGLVRKVEEEIRTLSYVLHPPLLDEFGLGSALNWYTEGFTKRSGIQVDVDCAKDLPRLKPEKEMALFRVVQEGLTNVLRHSGSKEARICVSFDAEFVALTVEDEGQGIDRKKLANVSSRMESGVGVAGMRERLQQFGGSLAIRARSKGTELTATVPIGESEPIEQTPSELKILKMAEELGYKHEPGEAQAHRTAAAPAGRTKRVLIADDHEVTRQGIRSLLKEEDGIEICGEARDGLETVIKAKELNPDLMIVDLFMPHIGGFSAAHQIRTLGLPPKILFFTTHKSPQMEKMIRLAGFEGLVQKTDAARDLVRGVRAVLEGKKFFGAEEVKAAQAPEEARKPEDKEARSAGM